MVTSSFYHIRIAGQLDPSWEDWLDGLAISHMPDGTTLLSGPLIDQAAVHGVLNKIRDLGLTLLAVQQVADQANPNEGEQL